MKDKFLIGELSKIFNISTDTLRHYDKIDLIKPEYDEKNDYRYYSIRNLFKLSRILEGSIPVPKRKLVEAWIEIHREDLLADWQLAVTGETVFKIKGLE